MGGSRRFGILQPHLAEQMLQKAVEPLLLFMGKPHAGGHLVSCRSVEATYQCTRLHCTVAKCVVVAS